jgi:hypothetical protein
MTLVAKRAPNFAESGDYQVATGDGVKVIYRDPDDRYWYESRSLEHYSSCFLAFTKLEALARLVTLYGLP